jgi:SpoIID/LytB domain protein
MRQILSLKQLAFIYYINLCIKIIHTINLNILTQLKLILKPCIFIDMQGIVLYNVITWQIYGGVRMKRRIIALFTAFILCFSTTTFAYTNSAYNEDLKIGLKNMVSSSIKVVFNGNYLADSQVFPSGTSIVLNAINGKIDFNGKQYSEIVFTPDNVDNTIRLEIGSKKYNYHGRVKFALSSSSILPINYVNIERYLKGVVGYEMSNSYPIEALKAQAVAARNYSLVNINKHRNEGFDLCDTIDCQVYRGYNSAYSNVERAVNETQGAVLLHNDKLVKAYYSASTGGYTEASGNIWFEQLPYLIVKYDDFESENWPYGDMRFNTSQIEVTLKSKKYLSDLDFLLKIDLDSIKRNESGRVSSIDIVYLDINGIEKRKSLTKEGPRIFLSLPSATYNVTYDQPTDTYTFSGKGYGHGVGLSQIGARNRARAGQTYEQILTFYYDGTNVQKLDVKPGQIPPPVTPAEPTVPQTPVYSLPSISNLTLNPSSVYEGRSSTLEIFTSGGSGQGVDYRFEVLSSDTIVQNRDYAGSSKFELSTLKAGDYQVKIYVKDKASTREYDDLRLVDITVLKGDDPSRGGSSPTGEQTLIKLGMKGSSVTELQKSLVTLGYSIGVVDGQFGNKTLTAVTAFQKSKSLSATGVVDRATLDAINKDVAAKNQPSTGTTSPVTTPAPTPAPVGTKVETLVYSRLLKSGIQGDDVKKLQNSLVGLGYKLVVVNGVYDTKTIAAVKDFQLKNKLSADGIAGKSTVTALNTKLIAGGTKSVAVVSRGSENTSLQVKANIKKGMKGADVKNLQEALKRLSYNIGVADGIFGSQTENAIKALQKTYKLSITGIVDSATANKINERLRQL